MTRQLAKVLAVLIFVIPTTAVAKEKDKGNFIPCQRVFVTGNQPYSVQWANENLLKHTCMAPQADASQATAILDLEPIPGVSGAPNYTPKENTTGYWIDCRSPNLGGVTCEDSEGHQTTTTCSFGVGYVRCSTYEGPDPVTALIKSLLDLLVRNSAYAYLYDVKTHELLWKYQGSWPWDKELMFDSACPKKRRGGTWGTSGGVPNGLSCDEQKLPTDLFTPRPELVAAPSAAIPTRSDNLAEKNPVQQPKQPPNKAASGLATSSSDNPTPFGFTMGMTRQQIISQLGQAAVKEDKGDTLILTTAPSPHPDFDDYVVIISPDKGLLKIVASGKTLSVNDEGDQLKEQFDDVYVGLVSKYGKGTRIDFVQGNDVNKESQYWMMTLLQKERTLAVYWNYDDKTGGNSRTGISLEAVALSISRGYVTLSYEFPGWDAYVDSKKVKQNSVF